MRSRLRWALCLAAATIAPALVSCGSSSREPGDGGGPSADGSVEPDGGESVDAGVIQAPSQSFYATDGGAIHLACQGSGRVPVVFLAGGDDRSSVWAGIVAALGPNVLTCTFDRPGVAPSYVSSRPLTPQIVADVLAETLPMAKIGSRFLFVGHSLAGLTLRVFGASYPERIAGVVFVDPTVPSSATSAASAQYVDWINGQIEHFGWDPQATESQGNAVTRWESDASVMVLSHDPVLAVRSGQFTESAEAIWDDGQKDYARLTSHGTQTFVTGASHYVFVTNPEVVVSAITTLLQGAR